MDNNTYSYLDEVWHEESSSSVIAEEENCKPLDDIMSIYTCAKPTPQPQIENKIIQNREYNMDNVLGYTNNPNMYNFDSYFDKDLNVLKKETVQKPSCIISEEAPSGFDRRTAIFENYEDSPKLKDYSELIIFILCGILLILLLDKLVNLGKSLR